VYNIWHKILKVSKQILVELTLKKGWCCNLAQRQFLTSDTSLWTDRYGDGSDGAGTAGSNVQTTASVAIDATALTAGSGTGFAAGNLIIIHQSRNGGTGVGNWELNRISSVGGGTDWTLAYATIYAYNTTAQVYLMKQYSSYNGTLATGTAWAGASGGIAGFFCNGTATITGGSSNGGGFRGGAGSVSSTSTQGEGETGAGSAATSANGSGGGGSLSGTGGTGGTAFQTVAGLTTRFVFGGAGGGGNARGGGNALAGGAGGGIVIIISKTIDITGSMTTNGANGAANIGGSDGMGGGGAGGTVLLKGQNITLGSTLITSTGGAASIDPGSGSGDGAGGGAGSANGTNGDGNGPGGAGAVGRIHADYSTSISGTTSPTIDTTVDSIYDDTPGGFFAFM